MRGSRARRGAGAVGSTLAAAALIAFGAVPAQAVGELSTVGEQSFSDIASCSSTAENLLVTIVVDESQSLQSTDPEAQRVSAILTALDSLEQLGSTTDLSVEANLTVFGSEFTELVGWGVVEGEHAALLRAEVADELPERDRANLTDYREALLGAKESLHQRAEALGTSSCKLVLWLTDGKLDVDGRGDRPPTDAARVDLCEPGGIVDGLRVDGVAVIALGLLKSEGQGSVTPQDRDRLQAIAEGTGANEACGEVPVGDQLTNGAFLNAEDAGALNRIFAQTVALIGGASNGRTVICPGDECIDGRLPIPVDTGVGGIRLVLETDEGAPAPQLVAPDGATAVLESAITDLGGAAVSVLDSNGLVSIDVRQPSVGTWTLITEPTSTTVVDLYYFWGISLALDAPDGVVIGQPSRVVVRALDTAGQAVDLAQLGSATLEATIDGTPTVFDLVDGSWTTELTVPAGEAVSSLQIAGRATATTAPNQIELGPVAIDQSQATTLPPSYPQVAPDRLDLGRLSGSTSATAVLTVNGADRGPTEVCFGAGEVTAPERAGSVSLGASADCVAVEANGSVDVEIAFSAQETADGLLEGRLPVSLAGVDGGDPVELSIPVTGSMVRPVDQGTRVGLVVAFTIGAIAMAVAAAAIARRILERFELSVQARYAEVPVRVTPAGLVRRDGQTPLIEANAMTSPGRRGKTTQMRVGPASYSVSYPFNPFASARGLVTGAGGQVPISDVLETVKGPARRRVALPGTSGFVIITERPDETTADGTIDGTLVMIVDPGRKSSTGHAALLPARLQQVQGVRWADEIERARRAWLALAAPESKAASKSGRGQSNKAPRAQDESKDGAPTRRRTEADSSTSGGPPSRRGAGSPSGTSDPSAPPPRRTAGAPPARDANSDGLPPRRGAPPLRPSDPSSRRPSSGPDDLPPPRR